VVKPDPTKAAAPVAEPSSPSEAPETSAATPTPSESPAVVAAVDPDVTAGGTGGSDPTGAGGGPGSGGTDGPTWGPMTSAMAALGLNLPDLPTLPLFPTVATTTGLAAASMAMGLFGRRRRQDDEPDPAELLAAQAAEGVGLGGRVAHGAGGGGGADPDAEDDGDAEAIADDESGSPADAEMAMPRWRRPSLLQARKADPLRTEPTAPRLFFDRGLRGTLAGHERRLVRYTVVRLLDVPDELRGREIGALGEGDEVELLERQGAYWLVACPDGGRGWIHKMTLGATVGGSIPDAPSATLPIAAESWTMGDDVDEDVLAAYLASRQRSD
jgi:hypothetical protein